MMCNLMDNIEESKKGTMMVVKGAIEIIKDASASMTNPQKVDSNDDYNKRRTYEKA